MDGKRSGIREMSMQELREMGKRVEKFTLKEALTIDELYQLMNQRWTANMPGKFKLKKGLFGKRIQFDVYMLMLPVVTVKGNVVTVRRQEQSTKVGGVDFKEAKQRMAAAKEGGLKKAATGGVEYFFDVRNAMRDILNDKII
jgi:hypothetical protein